jgi:tRNA pseudouridine55 synthase
MLDGVIVLNKHRGISSHQAVQRVKRLAGAKKAGHTGTLDPFATGVLPVLLNRATRIAQYLQNERKIYRAWVRLGEATNTLDFTGRVEATAEVPDLDEETVRSVLERFVGEQEQIPPMFSAVKIGGQPLYKLARKGLTVERKPKSVHVYSISLVGMERDTIVFEVECSSGTYVRVLATDIARELGTVGHLVNLVRLANGNLRLEHSVILEELKRIVNEGGLADTIYSMDEALAGFRRIRVTQDAIRRIHQGQGFDSRDLVDKDLSLHPEGGEKFRVASEDDTLVAIAAPLHGQRPDRVVRFRLLRVLV